MQQLEEVIALAVAKCADADSFHEVAQQVGRLEPADRLLVWLRTLSLNPDLVFVRLELAKLLCQLGCAPFALEQLQQIHVASASKNSEALKTLIAKLGGNPIQADATDSGPATDSRTLASLDLEFDEIKE